MFESVNLLSIHPIKKDKCDLCTRHEVGQFSDEAWNTHRIKKDKARAFYQEEHLRRIANNYLKSLYNEDF